MTAPNQQVDVRFYLPQGPQLEPKSWQRRNRTLIRVASIAVAVVLAVLGVGATVVGFVKGLTITAVGAVDVDCATEQVTSPSIGFTSDDTVTLYDAGDVRGGALATTEFTVLHRLGGGVCLAEFEVDVDSKSLYSVTIGQNFRTLVSAQALQAGYVFE